MRYRDDPILKAKAAEQSARDLQPGAQRHKRLWYSPADLWYKREPTGSALGMRLVLGLVVLGIILGIVSYLLLNR